MSIPIVISIVISLILMITMDDKRWMIAVALGIVLLVALYFLKDAIDWKYYQKHPPSLELPIVGLLQTIPFYKQLSTENKAKFERRLALFILAREYKVQPSRRSPDDEPSEAAEDIKAICSIPAIILTFYEEDYLIKEVEQVVLYNHPFPSPRYQQIHACESDKEDKLLIFSLPHLEKGVKEPFTYFDVGMYEWARITDNVSYNCVDWERFENTTGVSKRAFDQVIGLPKIDLPAICRVDEIHKSYVHTVRESQ